MCEPGASPFLLFADDEPDILGVLVQAAELKGYRYKTATTPEEILAQVNEHCAQEHTCFDALVLDVHYKTALARETGIGAVRAIRRKFPNLPVIFITAYNSTLTRNEALAVGQEVIVKPFDPMYVLNRAALWIAWAGKRRNWQGGERRSFGVNRSGQYRRATDAAVELARPLREIAAQAQKGQTS
jgi:CheY-like chemotaxis protein